MANCAVAKHTSEPKRLKTRLALLGCGLLLAAPLRAHDDLPASHHPLLPHSEEPAPGLLGDWWGAKPAMRGAGIDAGLAYIGEVLGNVSGGLQRRTVYDGLLKVWLDLDSKKLGLWQGGRLHTCVLYPHGDSLTGEAVGDLYTLSNIDTLEGFRAFELWYEQQLAEDKLSLRGGVLAVDEEFTLLDYGCNFVNSTFGWPAHLALNFPAPSYPFGVPGLRLAWAPTGRFQWQAGVYAGDPELYPSPNNPRNRHGLPWSMDNGAFVINEFIIKNEAGAAIPWAVRLGAFLHTGDFANQRLDGNGLSLADPASSGNPLLEQGNFGFLVAGERQLWKEADDPGGKQGLGGFARLGYCPPDRNLLQFYAETGLLYTGLIPGRDRDALGIALAYGQISSDLRQLAKDNQGFQGTSGPLPDYELVIETGYRAEVRPGWSLQPLLQYILHPGGSGQIPNALVLGLRSVMEF